MHIGDTGDVEEVYAKIDNTWEFGDLDEVGVLGRGGGDDWESLAFDQAFPGEGKAPR